MFELFKRLNWPQVAALAVIFTGAGLVVRFVPPAVWDKIDWELVLGAILSAAGVTASAFLGRLFHPTDDARVEAVKTPPGDAQ